MNLTYQQALTRAREIREAGQVPVFYFGSEPGRVAVYVEGFRRG